MRQRLLSLTLLAALAVVSASTAPGALAGPSNPPKPAARAESTVLEDPADWTPHVLDGQIRAIAVVGDTVVVGGDFTKVSESDGATTYDRWSLFSFSLRTGHVLAFDPDLDGPVLSLAGGPGNTVYVGGSFRKVGAVKQRGITRLDLATGNRVDGFNAQLGWGDTRSVAVSGNWLYLGGSFSSINNVKRKGLARVDMTTGAVDTRWDAKLEAPQIGRVRVEDFAISPQGDRLMAIGVLTQVGNDYRVQAAMFDLTGAVPKLANWWTDAYNPHCRTGFDTYLRGVDFSPDGKYLVIVTTGRLSGEQLLCDSAARFETYTVGKNVPTWVNHTGGDSLYAVEITDGAVYVGGHQRWMNNPHGHESAGPGAVSRKGVAAIDTRTGLALAWNPTRKRGVGVRAFAATPSGLLVGSDTDELGREYHGRIGLFPHPDERVR